VKFACEVANCCCILCLVRGHTVKAVTESFKMSKDAGFKVVTHMMPDLPNVGLERDIEQFIVSLRILVKAGLSVDVFPSMLL